ncbi:MAG TPA: hypothetical protein VNJ08_15975 [Bacteriovoracaceae bacterium]|nr:hypothetical protein [Bacteriovoracaceae bacterium]
MKIITLILFILLGCKSPPPPQQKGDEFDKIFHLKKTNDPKKLMPTLGEPEKIDTTDSSSDQYYFYKTKDQMPIKVFVSKKDQKITTIALAYLVKFDAYAYLKKRFKNYRWVETALPLRTHLDYAEEIFKVEIPELGMTFQYNNQDPLRRPEWIFFK